MYVSEDVTATLRAQDHGHPPVVCLNFQGSKSNNVVTEDGTAYSLNAMHGHDVHVVCFEPGIAKREGNDSRFVQDKSVTLRAQMGDNQPAVCFEERAGCDGGRKGILIHEDVSGAIRASYINSVCFQQNQREEVRDMGDLAGALTAESGMHSTNYVCYSMAQRQISMMVGENQTASLVSTDYKDPQLVCYEASDKQDDEDI